MPGRWILVLALAALAGCGGDPPPPDPEIPISFESMGASAEVPGDEPGREPNLTLPPVDSTDWSRPLDWLTRHQGPDGSWSAVGGGCPCGDVAGNSRPVGATALALLTYYHHGYRIGDRKYGRAIRSGLEHLLAIQDDEGAFGARDAPFWLLDQAIASVAVANAFGVSEAEFLARGARKGIDFLGSRRRRDGSWGGGPGETGTPDPMVTAWATLALHVGSTLDMVPSADVRAPIGGAVDVWTEEWMGGERHPDLRAALLLYLRAYGWDGNEASDPAIHALQESLVAGRPGLVAPGSAVDPAWLFIANLGLRISSVKMPHDHARCGPCWKWGPPDSPRHRWSEGLSGFIEERMRSGGCAAGSMDPVAAGPLGLGRVGATAFHSMTLASFF